MEYRDFSCTNYQIKVKKEKKNVPNNSYKNIAEWLLQDKDLEQPLNAFSVHRLKLCDFYRKFIHYFVLFSLYFLHVSITSNIDYNSA